MIQKEAKAAAIAHAQAEMAKDQRESCGLVIDVEGTHTYFPCRNIAVDEEGRLIKDAFVIHHGDYADACDEGDLIAVVHSHVGKPAEPSTPDLVAMSQDTLPWLIVSVPNGVAKLHQPPAVPVPLLNREYSFGSADCYSILRDYYKIEYGLDLPDFQRSADYDFRGEDKFVMHMEEAGFYEVPQEELRKDDAVLMLCGASNVSINHVGIYLGDGLILHHCVDRLSKIDNYSIYWRRNTVKIARHRGVDFPK